MILPYNVDIEMPRVPYANWALIGLTCITSMVFLADPESHRLMMLWRGENFAPEQLLTHLFAHAGIEHLVGNMIFLFVFGNAVNARLGHLLYVASYLVMGAVAGLAWLAIDQGRASLGASGAIMGVIGVFLVYYPKNDVSIVYWVFRGGTVSVSAYFVIFLYVALDLLNFFAKRADHVAHVSHLAGAATGFVIGSVLVMTKLVKPGPGEHTIWDAMKGQPKRPSGPIAGPRGATPLRPPPEGPRRPKRDEPAAPKLPPPPPGGWR